MILLPSAARTTNGTWIVGPTDTYAAGVSAVNKVVPTSRWRGGVFLLNITAAATAASDTLDVYVQSSIDDGTTFDDFVHFTQALGNAGAKKYIAQWIVEGTAPTTPLHAPQDAALAAGVSQGPVGVLWRIKWVAVDGGGADTSFTFSLAFEPLISAGR